MVLLVIICIIVLGRLQIIHGVLVYSVVVVKLIIVTLINVDVKVGTTGEIGRILKKAVMDLVVVK